MPLSEIQHQVNEWVAQYKIGYFKPHEILARLTEEVGELAREVNHRFGPKPKKPAEQNAEMADEMADIIFTVVCLANSQGIDLDEAFKRTMDKCYGRDRDRFEKKAIS
jgi:NTP pyrophosphatase (non-canonical NTP hydrolase)